MLPAVITACFFALSAVFSQRAARIFGPLQANAMRLGIACTVLGLMTLMVDGAYGVQSLHAQLYPMLFWSGLVGFGLGDIAMFRAYPLLGSRLTVLINLCTATLFGAAGDALLLGTHLNNWQWACVAGILAGLVTALWPEKGGLPRSVGGITYAVIAGLGMGGGTVLTGKVNALAAELHLHCYGISQAFQRSSAGLLAALAALLLLPSAPAKAVDGTPLKWRHKPFWIMGTALFGPVVDRKSVV